MPIVRAKYFKEVEVTDEISKEEIERISKYGMPDRFDGMADQIDNEKPLEFVHWDYVPDKYHEEPKPDIKLTKPDNTEKTMLLINLLTAFIFAIIFGIAWGCIKHDVLIGLVNFGLYLVIYIPVTITVNWIRKVNKHMKGESNNV